MENSDHREPIKNCVDFLEFRGGGVQIYPYSGFSSIGLYIFGKFCGEIEKQSLLNITLVAKAFRKNDYTRP